MYLVLIFLCSFLIPFLLKKSKSKWLIWFPTVLFSALTIIFELKAMFFPAPEMAVLGEILYFMIFGSAAIGSAIGGLIVRKMKRNI